MRVGGSRMYRAHKDAVGVSAGGLPGTCSVIDVIAAGVVLVTRGAIGPDRTHLQSEVAETAASSPTGHFRVDRPSSRDAAALAA